MSSDPQAGLFEYTAGLDIGNGYVKGVIEDRGSDTAAKESDVAVDIIDMPSVAATLIRPNLLQTPDADAPQVLAGGQEWFDNADMVFSSNLVPDTYRRVIGRRALATKASSVDAFDLVGHKSKAEQPLSKVLVLGILAAKALRDYVAVSGFRAPTTPTAQSPHSLFAQYLLSRYPSASTSRIAVATPQASSAPPPNPSYTRFESTTSSRRSPSASSSTTCWSYRRGRVRSTRSTSSVSH